MPCAGATKMPVDPAGDSVSAVRAFNRFYTNVIGVLREGVLRTPYSLTEGRVIFELGQRDSADLADLRSTLDIDAGYLSRIVARFETNGLVARGRSDVDARRQVIELTDDGRAAFELLDRRSAEEVAALLSDITQEDERRLVGAMAAIQEILDDSRRPEPFVLRAPAPGDFGWIVHSHGVLYAEAHGWGDRFEALVARIVADYAEDHDPKREAVWIADLDGEPIGCVFCVRNEDKVAQLRLLLVEPRFRGMGIGARLVDECIRFAKRTGYEQIMLWTNDVLADARRIYERAGFELGDEEPHRDFGPEVVGQHWWRAL